MTHVSLCFRIFLTTFFCKLHNKGIVGLINKKTIQQVRNLQLHSNMNHGRIPIKHEFTSKIPQTKYYYCSSGSISCKSGSVHGMFAVGKFL